MGQLDEIQEEMRKPLEERAEALRNATEEKMREIRPMFFTKSDNVFQRARDTFVAGRRFKVIKEGARLEGIVTFGDHAWAGYAKTLQVGEIVTCNGWREGMSGGAEEANFTAAGVPWNALWVQVWPQDGLWRPWPMDGVLEPLDDEQMEKP